MQPREQLTYKPVLLTLRTRLTRSVQDSEEALRQDVMAPGEITSLPTHPADQDAEGVVEEIAIAQNEEALLEQVEAALARLEAGNFGACEHCGHDIASERLDAIPYAALCAECARREEAARKAKA